MKKLCEHKLKVKIKKLTVVGEVEVDYCVECHKDLKIIYLNKHEAVH